MENFIKIGEIRILRPNDATETLEALKTLGFEICLYDADGYETTYIIMGKKK